jgi:RimJ/RimL family protein N-acetyltransferase
MIYRSVQSTITSMQSDQIAEDGTVLPKHLRSKLPAFETERFRIQPLNPEQARQLAEQLLQDERLAEYVTWMEDKSRNGAYREAFLLQMQCAAGTVLCWGIVERDSNKFIGALLARPTIEGLDLEVLCEPSMWEQDVTDEAAVPVAEWMQDHCEVETVKPN